MTNHPESVDALCIDIPMTAFVGTDAAEEAGGLQVGEMFLYGFRGYSDSSGQRGGAEGAVL